MDFLFKGTNEEGSKCPLDENDIQRCPFLRNINKTTCFPFSSANFLVPVSLISLPLMSLFHLFSSSLLVDDDASIWFNPEADCGAILSGTGNQRPNI